MADDLYLQPQGSSPLARSRPIKIDMERHQILTEESWADAVLRNPLTPGFPTGLHPLQDHQ